MTAAGGTISEREYFESRIGAIEVTIARDVTTLRELLKAHSDAHSREHVLQSAALEVEARYLREWKELTNEFRAQLTDQAATFTTKAELAAMEKEYDRRVGALELERSNASGRFSAVTVAVAVGLPLIGLALAIILAFSN